MREQGFLVCLLREAEEDEDGADEDRDHPGRVGPLVAVKEGRLRAGDDLTLDRTSGTLDAVSAALANDFVNSAWVLAETFFPEVEMSEPAAVA